GGVRRRESPHVDAETVRLYEEVTDLLNTLLQQNYTLGAYITCFTSTDANDETAQKAQSELNIQRARLDPLMTRYIAWVGTTDVEALMKASEIAQAHSFFLSRARFL